ncbi:hypothetical protein [Streptomyces sp. NPDC002559]
MPYPGRSTTTFSRLGTPPRREGEAGPALLHDPLVATAIRGRELHRGAVIGVARLTDCHSDQGPKHCASPWAQRNVYHLVLDDVHELPLPVPGADEVPVRAWRWQGRVGCIRRTGQ